MQLTKEGRVVRERDSERDRSAALRLVRRGLAHDAKVQQVSAVLLLLDRTGQLSANGWQPRAHAGTDGDRQGSNLAGNLGARRRAREFCRRFGAVCTGRLCACAPPDRSLALR